MLKVEIERFINEIQRQKLLLNISAGDLCSVERQKKIFVTSLSSRCLNQQWIFGGRYTRTKQYNCYKFKPAS